MSPRIGEELGHQIRLTRQGEMTARPLVVVVSP